jgi:hypothetical protein
MREYAHDARAFRRDTQGTWLASDYQFIDSGTLPDGDVGRGYPTPTILYNNRDVCGMPEPAASHRPAT